MVLKKQMVDEDVLTLARRRFSRIFDEYDRVTVSFSGGKDSTVCLNLALEEAERRNLLPLDVIFWDEEALHPETIEYVDRVSRDPRTRFRWLCLPIQHRNACSRQQPFWYPWAPEDRPLWCRPLPPGAIDVLNGFTRKPVPELNGLLFPDRSIREAVIVGIRAAESLRRYRAVAHRTTDNWISQDPEAPWVSLVKPVYDWTTNDVWVAPHKLGWDYNRTYDILTKLGINAHEQRVCPPYGEEPLRSLWIYAQAWPELWERMCARVAGAETASRYSQSPLYNFKASGKASDMSYQQAISEELDKWPDPAIRMAIADRIRSDIELHYRKNPDTPIPDRAKDQLVAGGMSWEFLYMIAVRGDLKGRKDATSAEWARRKKLDGKKLDGKKPDGEAQKPGVDGE